MLLIDPHRSAHHYQQIRIAKIDRAERGILHIDPVELISGRFNGFAITRNPFVRHVADNESLFGHLAVSIALGRMAMNGGFAKMF